LTWLRGDVDERTVKLGVTLQYTGDGIYRETSADFLFREGNSRFLTLDFPDFLYSFGREREIINYDIVNLNFSYIRDHVLNIINTFY
jgi:hypothetical protein